MQDWFIFGAGLTVSALLAQAGPQLEMPSWLTTIGPWGVMYLVIDRLTRSHSKALDDLGKSVDKLAVILAKVEGIKSTEEEKKERG